MGGSLPEGRVTHDLKDITRMGGVPGELGVTTRYTSIELSNRWRIDDSG